MATILITGGTGLIGRYLFPELQTSGHQVRILSRTCKRVPPPAECFRWNPEKASVPEKALAGTEVLVHLAGANIGKRRWTRHRKREILASRVRTIELLWERYAELGIWPKTVISASAVGYYGLQSSPSPHAETDPPGSDFLAMVCTQWEKAAMRFQEKGVRTVIFRLGVVLTPEGGVLGRMLPPAKLRLLSPFGSGTQPFPWIHIADVVSLFRTAAERPDWSGMYNAVAPHCVTNAELVYTLAGLLNKQPLLPGIPALMLRIAFGEMADTLLKGSCISAEKLLHSGFRFQFPRLRQALEDLLRRAGELP
jgi:hypothetical protein